MYFCTGFKRFCRGVQNIQVAVYLLIVRKWLKYVKKYVVKELSIGLKMSTIFLCIWFQDVGGGTRIMKST